MAKIAGFSGLQSMSFDIVQTEEIDLGTDLFSAEVDGKKRDTSNNTNNTSGRVSADQWLLQNPMPEAASAYLDKVDRLKMLQFGANALAKMIKQASFELVQSMMPEQTLIGFKTTSLDGGLRGQHPDVVIGRTTVASDDRFCPVSGEKIAEAGDVVQYLYLTAGCWLANSGVRYGADGKGEVVDAPLATVKLPITTDKAVQSWYASKIGLKDGANQKRTQEDMREIFLAEVERLATLPDPTIRLVNLGYTAEDLANYKAELNAGKVRAEDHPAFKRCKALGLKYEVSALGVTRANSDLAIAELSMWIDRYNAPILDQQKAAEWIGQYARSSSGGEKIPVPYQDPGTYLMQGLLADLADVFEIHDLLGQKQAAEEIKAERAELNAETLAALAAELANTPDLEID